jgi:hypothetical protein
MAPNSSFVYNIGWKKSNSVEFSKLKSNSKRAPRSIRHPQRIKPKTFCILLFRLLRQYQEEKRVKIEEERQMRIECELIRQREQQELEIELEKARLKQIEMEQKRVEAEQQKLIEQEMSYKKCLPVESLMDKIDNEIKNFEKSIALVEMSSVVVAESTGGRSEALSEPIAESKANDMANDEKPLSNDKDSKNSAASKFILPVEILAVYTEWRKYNANNLLDNVRQEHNYKLKQLESNKTENKIFNAPKTTSNKKLIPESLLLKNSNQKNLSDIDTLHFQALTSYSLSTFELCINLTVLTIINSQITTLDSLYNCSNLKYIDAQVMSCLKNAPCEI